MGRPMWPWILTMVALVICVLLWRISPMWPGPPLPPSAERLYLETEPLHLIPALACPGALLGPVRVATAGDALVVVSPDSGDLIRVVWPSGWVAWRISGRGKLVNRDGGIVGREGEIIPPQFGGGEYPDGVFRVCEIGWYLPLTTGA